MSSVVGARADGWRQRKSAMVAEAWTPYYLLLAVLGASTIAVRGEHGRTLLIDVSLCVITAAWMLGMYTLNPGWRRRTGDMAVFVGGLVVLR